MSERESVPVPRSEAQDRREPRGAIEHELKCWPEPFAALLTGEKVHEVRKADRDFRVGDTLRLREWSKGQAYSGREHRVTISYITNAGEWGLPADVCVLSVQSPAALRSQLTAAEQRDT